MAYDAKTQRLISLKKLAGKAQTSNDKDLANEGLPSGITLASNTVFGQSITTSPSSNALYTITGKVEYIRFPATFIAGTDTSDGRHGFELKLPSDYESNSSNSKAGTYPFVNNQSINITSGSLQLIPPSFAASYEAKPFYGGTGTKNSGTQIPILDSRDWYMDYFNGILFQQDPPGTGDHAENPDFVEAYLYIGDMVDTVVSNVSDAAADKSAQYLVLSATASLPNERVFAAGAGLSASDTGAGGSYTLAINSTIVPNLTGVNVFSGQNTFSEDVSASKDLYVADDLWVSGGLEVLRETSFGSSSTASDVFFFVSGSKGSRHSTTNKGVSVFGGDLVISGTLYAERQVIEVDEAVTGSLLVSGSLSVSQSAEIQKGLTVNTSKENTSNFIVYGSSPGKEMITTNIDNNLVMILSGGAAASTDEFNYADTAFFVSGSTGSRGSSTRGTAVFGGDVYVSGAFYSDDINITDDLIVGDDLTVSGDILVAEYIKHIGDDDTFIQFADDAIGITAGGEQLITISEAGQDIVKIGDGGDVDFQVRTLNDDNTLYVLGQHDRVGIGLNNPATILHIKESAPTVRLQRESNSSESTLDFAGAQNNVGASVSHDANTNDLKFNVFNGSGVEEILRLGDHYGTPNRQVIFLSGSRMHVGAMQPRQASDIAFFVSGAIGSRSTSVKGTAVFGGDLHISGSLTVAGSKRIKNTYSVTSSHAASSPLVLPGVNFGDASFDPSAIDLYVNGALMSSGSSEDYTLQSGVTGSVLFAFKLMPEDTITTLLLK